MEPATAGVQAVSPAGWRVDVGMAWDGVHDGHRCREHPTASFAGSGVKILLHRRVSVGLWCGRVRRFELQMAEVRVDAVARQQLVMGAVFGYYAVFDDDNLVGVAQGA